MLSCKNCGAQMSGTDLVCKNCGTPWGKKHKSRKGIYFSIFFLLIIGLISYIYYVPTSRESFMNFYTNLFATNSEIKNENKNVENSDNISEIPISEPETSTSPENIKTEPEPEQNSAESEKVILPPTFSWASSSSFLKDYPIEFATDGKLETAWLEGVKGNGIGEWIMYSAETEQTVSNITLYNGYLKNDKVFINNGRIKKLSIEFSDGEIITKDIPKSSYSTSKNGFVITLDAPKTTTSIKLTILDAYQGAYYTDTAISEINFN